jgi:hypothetical protein
MGERGDRQWVCKKNGKEIGENLRLINASGNPSTRGVLPGPQGECMATYFMFGAIGQCPHCADHRFSGPPLLTPEASVTCHKCGQSCSVELAVATALRSGVVKKLSDHRVVQDRAMDGS